MHGVEGDPEKNRDVGDDEVVYVHCHISDSTRNRGELMLIARSSQAEIKSEPVAWNRRGSRLRNGRIQQGRDKEFAQGRCACCQHRPQVLKILLCGLLLADDVKRRLSHVIREASIVILRKWRSRGWDERHTRQARSTRYQYAYNIILQHPKLNRKPKWQNPSPTMQMKPETAKVCYATLTNNMLAQ